MSMGCGRKTPRAKRELPGAPPAAARGQQGAHLRRASAPRGATPLLGARPELFSEALPKLKNYAPACGGQPTDKRPGWAAEAAQPGALECAGAAVGGCVSEWCTIRIRQYGWLRGCIKAPAPPLVCVPDCAPPTTTPAPHWHHATAFF